MGAIGICGHTYGRGILLCKLTRSARAGRVPTRFASVPRKPQKAAHRRSRSIPCSRRQRITDRKVNRASEAARLRAKQNVRNV